ncbi:MAG: phosphatase PAP2 family protein [Sphingobacteriia bacterium]|nr:MAG: phosphatase PAP2 family protein [Sphingobacteriia bacterium]TAG32072.1 MAG: phosphatase PAP2 family protein [Sphingobacteriia bacterium]TAH09397.1 MAG: phosphatase PAP2 family protein [Sphingobacteriia bacterium]
MNEALATSWEKHLKNKDFKLKLLIGLSLLILLIPALPVFFDYIEQRKGVVLNDLLLNLLPAWNVSIPTFIIIWILVVFTLYRCVQNPAIFLLLLWSYLFLTMGRIVSLLLVPLDPPQQIIELKDPLSNLFYGSKFITKDLFFSGHTATLFTMYLCLQKKADRLFLLVGSIVIALLVLIQHVHYTMDVIAAFIFSYIFFKLGKRITELRFS